MKYGFILSWGTPADILEMARAAEAHGWDGVFTWDGVSVGGTPSYDPWVLMGAMATVTERVTLGALILPLARRRPWKVAKEAVTIDHLSHGRLVLPVGVGVQDDRAFAGVNTEAPQGRLRAQRLDECLEILRLAQTGETFSFDGHHYQVEEMLLLPKPVQERIPVWCVGSWPHQKPMRRAVRWDGLVVSDSSPDAEPGQPMPPDRLRELVAWVREHREGDAPFDIVMEGTTSDADDTGYVQDLEETGVTWFLESRWDERETPDRLMARITAGPPRL